ncbi:MAG TPA: glycoside hydrolase family 2 TIM barrel-domain containing protein [Chitinophagaceae bacterium]|nr:glycoside hydrolase family 2 TIM barrel-domain containing protein [Chitinophagaceae bacterium]
MNGKWQVIVDPFNAGAGNWKPVWKDQHPTGKNDFYEYAFTNKITLNVPGDWNHQKPSLLYYESTIWYKKTFTIKPAEGKKYFLYFAAVNYECDVYINNQYAGSHEGGFTPFQFDITGEIKDTNSIIVRVNNQRKPDNIPAMNYDWWNYGGITRDVMLIETPATYISDYCIGLAKNTNDTITGWIQLAGENTTQSITLRIAGLQIDKTLTPGAMGRATFSIAAKPGLWQPGNAVLYKVAISCGADKITDNIGFRNISVSGTDILLNGKPVFLRGINIHEEIPQQRRRAWSAADARQLLNQAKELGCNFVRLTHYSHNEHMVRLADSMGIMLWEEVPLWQNIQFTNPAILNKADTMLKEMITRDKNRCSIIMWSMSNETSPTPARTQTITAMAEFTRSIDDTRLITSAINDARVEGNNITINDPLCNVLDVIGVNEYLGWYTPWPAKPQEMAWHNLYNKPLIMSEFGAESLYGNHGSADSNGYWAEERQEQVLKEQVAMFKNIPFLRGTCPWILADFRSETRLQPVYQQGWNRKGLLSDKGLKKKAWYVINAYYNELKR